MNYRHHFHAGNFADLLKHAVLLDLLERATATGSPAVEVFETHAGAGVYALASAGQRRSFEAQAGIDRLLDAGASAPPILRRLADRVRAFSRRIPVTSYPGSPVLAVGALRSGDRYLGCELRPDDHEALAAALRPMASRGGVEVRTGCVDGYAKAEALPGSRPCIVLIDPPFERGDEAQRIVRLVDRLAGSSPDAQVAIWAPLKDLESLDRLRAGVETVARRPGWIVEARLRSLRDPLAMNGCAMIVLGAVQTASAALSAASWIADNLGDTGAEARLQALDVGSRNPRADGGFASSGVKGTIDVGEAREATAAKRRR